MFLLNFFQEPNQTMRRTMHIVFNLLKKLDHWGWNFFAFDSEINVLLCKDDYPKEMAMINQDVT